MIGMAQTAPPSRAAQYSPLAAEYAAVWDRLHKREDDSPPLKVIGVMSSSRGEGVSTVAANLAIAAAWEDAGSVLLLDGQLLSPGIHAALRVPASPAWIDAVTGGNPIRESTQTCSVENLFVAAGGKGLRRSVRPRAKDLRQAIAEVRDEFSRIIVDLPPLADVGTSLATSTGLDGVVLVVEARRARRPAVQQVVRQLADHGTDVLGVVFNKCAEVTRIL